MSSDNNSTDVQLEDALAFVHRNLSIFTLTNKIINKPGAPKVNPAALLAAGVPKDKTPVVDNGATVVALGFTGVVVKGNPVEGVGAATEPNKFKPGLLCGVALDVSPAPLVN